ncbi:MAG: peptidyl-prolyl cis-trans isomerase [candidate division WOR-3 bacterium]
MMLEILILKISLYNDEGYRRAKQYETLFEIEKAKEEYIKLSKKYKKKDLAILYKELADLYFFYYYPDSIKKAYEFIEKAYKLDKKNDEIVYRLGIYSEAMGNYQLASKYYEEIAIKFQKSEYLQDAIDGVERVFPKNYKDEIVAKYGNNYITLMELDKEIENQPPFIRAKYETYEGKKELIERMIENRILLQKAIEEGYYKSYKFREELYNRLKDEFARVYYNVFVSRRIKVDSSEVKDFYEKNKQNYRIWGFVNLKIMKWEDETKLPEDSIFNKEAKLITFSENSSDSLLYKYFSQKDTNKMFLDKIRDTLYAIEIIKIQKPDYTKLEDIYSAIESNLRFDKERRTWEKTLDSLLNLYGYEELNYDTLSKEIPETLAIIKKLNLYITKTDYEDYLSKVPAIYRKAYSTKEGAYDLVKIFVQREILFRNAIVYDRIFIKSDGYNTLKNIFENLVINELRSDVLKNVSISEDEIEKYYNENKENQFKIPANAKIRIITFDKENEARRVFNIISKNPQKFDSLAKSIAKDKEEREFGGFKFITENDPIFEKIKNLKIGKPSILKFDDKWAVVSVQELNKAKFRELSEVKEQIEQMLLIRKKDQEWKEFLNNLKSKENIEILIKDEENKKENQGG